MNDFENTYKVLQEFADEVEVNYKTAIIENDLIASGNLANSIRMNVNRSGQRFSVVMSLEDYWKFIENGRKPGGKFPPPDVIRSWIETKPVLPTSNGKLPTLNQLSFLIGRKIARDGIPAKPILSEAVEHVFSLFEEKIIEALIADIDNISFALLSSSIQSKQFKNIHIL